MALTLVPTAARRARRARRPAFSKIFGVEDDDDPVIQLLPLLRIRYVPRKIRRAELRILWREIAAKGNGAGAVLIYIGRTGRTVVRVPTWFRNPSRMEADPTDLKTSERLSLAQARHTLGIVARDRHSIARLRGSSN